MPKTSSRRLAGVRFEVQPPPLEERLPRMDIAVFVGFAAAGPLNVPVLVEDVARFAQLFGDDFPLAWDPITGQVAFAHLGPAVRQFFLNGGRRCWAIRVARKAQTDYFPLPGLLELAGKELRPAFASARSPGSWFDRFGCATALAVQIIPTDGVPVSGDCIAWLRSGNELGPGDLLRFRFPHQGIEAFGVVQELRPATQSPPQLGSHAFVVHASELRWFEQAKPEAIGRIQCEAIWTRLPQRGTVPPSTLSATGVLRGGLSSPPDAVPPGKFVLEIKNTPFPTHVSFIPPPGAWLELQMGGDVLWFMVDDVQGGENQGASPPEDTIRILGRGYWLRNTAPTWPVNAEMIAEKLTFELHARSGQADAMRMLDLGFAWQHPRAWSALPSDDSLFPPDVLAGQVLGQDDSIHQDLRLEARENPSGGARFPVAGFGDSSKVYLPLLMPALPQPFLSAESGADDALIRAGLDTFGADLFLDPDLTETFAETLSREADYIRYEQPDPRPLLGLHAALGLEEATLIAIPDAVHPGWDLAPCMQAPTPQHSAPLPHPCWGLSDNCGYEANPPTGTEPRYDKFLDCNLCKLNPPMLELLRRPDELGTFIMQWSSPDAAAAFILEEAGLPDFSDTTVVFQGNQQQRTFLGKPGGDYYYRVRAVAGEETSNWSNEVLVTVPPQIRYVMRAVAEKDGKASIGSFDLAPLLDIHRSLLRLSAARGDLLAVLALPAHFRADDCLNYASLLRGTRSEASIAATATLPLNQGETGVLSFGAIYHPWLIIREADGLLYSPPDGAATGVVARRSLERGAWLAPANELFRGVIALTPRLGDGRRLDLLLAQLNQITQEANGFLSLNQDTLSADSELRPINVRRLLILLRRAALIHGVQYVFEPNSGTLRRLVQIGFESLLDQLFVRGAFAGATRDTSYEVVTDASINPPQSIELGQFRVDLKVAPSEPMSFITVRLVQTGERGVATELI